MKSEPSQGKMRVPEQWPEYAKFGVLLVVLLGTVACIALAGPFLIKQVIPTILGLDSVQVVTPAAAVEPLSQPVAPKTGTGGGQQDADPVLRHTVQEGETLYRISVIYDIPVESIAAANNIINPNQLQAGTVLIIPRPGGQ